MSEVFIIGANHRTAPLSLRESISVPSSEVVQRLLELKDTCTVSEAAIISTCNRTEVYGLMPSQCSECGEERRSCRHEMCPDEIPNRVSHWLAGDYVDGIYRLHDRSAVEHLFRVASGMDSQIIGEPEITGQVKKAAIASRQAGLAGVVIGRLFEHSLSAAKDVRQQTDIGKHSISYPSLAASLAAGIFSKYYEMSVLFIGSGEMTAAGVKIFSDRGVPRITIAARNIKKALTLANDRNAEVISISTARERLAEFDVVVCCSSSQLPIIGKGAVESAMLKRRRKPIMFADMAMPRDLEPEISNMEDVFVYTLEQFGELAQNALANRRNDLTKAQVVVGEHVEKFFRWLKERRRVPLVHELRQHSENLRQQEVDWAKKRLICGDSPEVVLENMSRRLTKKLLHTPSRMLAESELHDDTPDTTQES